MAFDLSMLLDLIKPYLNKLGDGLFSMQNTTNSKDLCVLITKRKDDNGKTHTFMSFIERPSGLNELLIKDQNGKPMMMGIEGLASLFNTDSNEDK